MSAATKTSARPSPARDRSAVRRTAVDGQAVDGQAVDGQAVDGQAVDGQAVDGQAVDGQAVDGQAVGGRRSAVGGRRSAVGGRRSAVGGRWSVVGGRWSVVGGRWSVARRTVVQRCVARRLPPPCCYCGRPPSTRPAGTALSSRGGACRRRRSGWCSCPGRAAGEGLVVAGASVVSRWARPSAVFSVSRVRMPSDVRRGTVRRCRRWRTPTRRRTASAARCGRCPDQPTTQPVKGAETAFCPRGHNGRISLLTQVRSPDRPTPGFPSVEERDALFWSPGESTCSL